MLHNENANKFEPHARPRPVAASFPPLADEVREVVPTDNAAFYLGRQPQTLRRWSCLGGGLLQPVRIGTRLGWKTAEIRALLQGGAE